MALNDLDAPVAHYFHSMSRLSGSAI